MSKTHVDTLEPRKLLAATATYESATGTLTLRGSGGSDNYELARLGKTQVQVTYNGKSVLTFNVNGARTVVFNGFAGHDILSMGRVPMALRADGGADDDSISASAVGRYGDTIFGGTGNDYIYGGLGNDTIDGGLGNDIELGGRGDDYLYALSGTDGDDTLVGGSGEDTADFTQYDRGVRLELGLDAPTVTRVDDLVYNDIGTIITTVHPDHIINTSSQPVTVYLRGGNDTYRGSAQRETVYGGAGDDNINTVGGTDVIVDTQGTNTLTGGSGIDTINGVIDLNGN